MIPNIPVVGGESIPFIQVNGTGVKLIQNIRSSNIGVRYISDARIWTIQSPKALPITVPVTMEVGTPIVNMPGCVKVHKENAKNPKNRNKMLVDDDPKGNTVLCDAGAPYYEPADYDYRGLSWQTIYTDSEEAPEGIDTGEPPAPEIPDPPGAPETPGETAGEVECPPPNARRIGDLNQAGTEKVIGYELTPDGKICETQWEALGFAEKYLPSVPIVSTTATIAVVATSSALLAKPLADLLLKVIKPLVKKVSAKVKKALGKTTYRPTASEIRTNQYREKKGMLPKNFEKDHQKKEKSQKKSQKKEEKKK